MLKTKTRELLTILSWTEYVMLDASELLKLAKAEQFAEDIKRERAEREAVYQNIKNFGPPDRF